MGNDKEFTRKVLIVLAVLLAVLLIWGFVGGSVASDVGVTCDVGIGDSLCWKWHTNIVGQIQEGLGDLFDNSGS